MAEGGVGETVATVKADERITIIVCQDILICIFQNVGTHNLFIHIIHSDTIELITIYSFLLVKSWNHWFYWFFGILFVFPWLQKIASETPESIDFPSFSRSRFIFDKNQQFPTTKTNIFIWWSVRNPWKIRIFGTFCYFLILIVEVSRYASR